MSGIESAGRTKAEGKKLSYVSLSFNHLNQWIDTSRDSPAKFGKYRKNFSRNSEQYLLDRRVLSVSEPRTSDKHGSILSSPSRIGDGEWTSVSLTVQRKATDVSSKQALLVSLVNKLEERKKIFAEIEALEFGVSSDKANDRFSLLIQLLKDLPCFNNVVTNLMTQGIHSPKPENVDYQALADRKDFRSGEICNIFDRSPSFLELFWRITNSLFGEVKGSEIKQFPVIEPALLSTILLTEILAECSITTRVVVENSPDPLVCQEHFTGKNVPMIVFSNTDINSAVDAAVNAAWFTEGCVPWATSCVLVQEGIQAEFITALKERLQQSAEIMAVTHTSLHTEREYEANLQQVLATAKENHLEVFEVHPPNKKRQPATLVIGDFVSCSITVTSWTVSSVLPVLFVVPFRKIQEGIAMANSSVEKIAASVWSESYTQCMSALSQLEFGTIWVNSHGIFDSRVPFFGRGLCCEPYRPTGIDYFHWNKSLAYFGSVSSSEGLTGIGVGMQKCLALARKGFLSWAQKDLHDYVKVLDKTWNEIDTKSVSPDLKKQLFNSICGLVPSSLSFHMKNCLVSSTNTPIGIIIFVVESKEVSKQLLLKLVLSAVFARNAVIVAGLAGPEHELDGLKLALPENILSVTNDGLGHRVRASLHTGQGVNINVWGVNKDHVRLNTCWDKELVKYYAFTPDIDIRHHVTQKKVVWMPVS